MDRVPILLTLCKNTMFCWQKKSHRASQMNEFNYVNHPHCEVLASAPRKSLFGPGRLYRIGQPFI